MSYVHRKVEKGMIDSIKCSEVLRWYEAGNMESDIGRQVHGFSSKRKGP